MARKPRPTKGHAGNAPEEHGSRRSLPFPPMSADFGNPAAEEKVRLQVRIVEQARDELDAIRMEEASLPDTARSEEEASLNNAEWLAWHERLELAQQVLAKAEDKLNELSGIDPAVTKARRGREELRELERKYQSEASRWRRRRTPSQSVPAPSAEQPESIFEGRREGADEDERKPIERLAAALDLNIKQTYYRLPRMPGVSKTGTTKKSHWIIPDPEASARRWLAGERRND